MKKNIFIFSTILIMTILTVLFLNLPIFKETDNFWLQNAAFFITIILTTVLFLNVKKYSSRIAYLSILLLFFVYTLFAWSIEINSSVFTRNAIILTQMAIITFVIISGIIIQNKTKNKIKQEISKYVAGQILDNLDNSNPTQTAKGIKEVLTVMFIDIRDFTSISEKHSAEEVSEILNDYFKEIIPVIKRHNGIINKFIGDALLVVFKGENPEIHAQNAVRAGKDILRKLKNFRQVQEAQGKDKITAGIGINTGEVFIGYVGTDDCCEYTVIGDTVNIASRTESTNRIYKTEFLITENTYKYVKTIADVIKISDVQLKGKREKVNVYEVLRIAESE